MQDEGIARSLDPFSIRRENGGIGIYEVLGCDGELLYVGLGNLRFNLKQHLPSGWFPINEGRFYRKRPLPDDMSAKECIKGLISRYERESGKAPKYNRLAQENNSHLVSDLEGLI